jgi:hypothetical protein
VIWVFLSIFQTGACQRQSLGSFTHWVMAAAITFSFPYFAQTYGGGPYSYSLPDDDLQLLFVWKIMRETKANRWKSRNI